MGSPPTFSNLVGGAWVGASRGATFVDENPADRGSVLGHFAASTPADVGAAVAAAAAAFPGWRATSLRERQDAATRFLGILRERREELARIITRENGKTIRESRAELDSAVVEGTYHVQQAARFFGHGLPGGRAGAPGPGGAAITGWVQYQPLGVAALICPWNFPVNALCRKALPALLTGNTVVFKPASFTPWSGVLVAELFAAAGFPAGVFNCVTGAGSDLGDALVEDARVKAVSFTGSTEIGRRIQAKAAPGLKRTQLELGGKNAVIVMDDADLEAAAEAIATAGFTCAGQWCTSTSRILVHASVRGRLAEMLAARCSAVILGDPMEESTGMGPVAGPAQQERITRAIARAKEQGAALLAGGGAPPKGSVPDGYYVRPTLFDGVDPRSDLFREEVFGPVLGITAFGTLEEALRLANDSAYGLSSALFTRDLAAALSYVDGIEAGLAHVNVHTAFKDPSLPFGGWKDSGSGLPENDSSGLEFFVNRKAVYMSGGTGGKA